MQPEMSVEEDFEFTVLNVAQFTGDFAEVWRKVAPSTRHLYYLDAIHSNNPIQLELCMRQPEFPEVSKGVNPLDFAIFRYSHLVVRFLVEECEMTMQDSVAFSSWEEVAEMVREEEIMAFYRSEHLAEVVHNYVAQEIQDMLEATLPAGAAQPPSRKRL